jgi:hypothetical protein
VQCHMSFDVRPQSAIAVLDEMEQTLDGEGLLAARLKKVSYSTILPMLISSVMNPK